MAGEWRQASIGALCDAGVAELQTGPFGTQLHAYDYVDDGVPVVPTEAIRGRQIDHSVLPKITRTKAQELERHRLRSGDILFARRGVQATGHIGCVRAAEDGFICGTGAIRLRVASASDEIDPDYLSHVLADPSSVEWFKFHAIGATMPNLNEGIIRSFQLSVPPLAEQRAIAHILGTLDDKIELNRRMSETLEAMARALFKSWFVDFDPVRAKAASRPSMACGPRLGPIGEAEGKDSGLPKHLADLFPDSFEDSELGEIPREWEVKSLSDLCSTQYGYTASAVDEPIGPKFLRVTDINKRNWIEWADVPHCAVEPKAGESYALCVGDLVVARMADPGKSAIIEEKVDAVFASYLVRLKTTSLANSYYVYGFLKSDQYAEYSAGAKSGSVQANMNARVIVGARLVVPTPAVVEQYLHAILPLRRQLVATVRESRTLATLRDTLLPKLISGELRVKNTERVAEVA